jgi:uncharacterized protein
LESYLLLSGVSFVAWLISTLAGGGSPFMLIPLVNLLFGPALVPPAITVGMFCGNAHRTLIFWREIDWKLTLWCAPGAIAGAILGAYTFTQIHLDWLQLLIGIFLLISIAGIGFDEKVSHFQVKAWYILPAGFLKAFVSGLVGTTGPVLNAFYINYGLVKEQLVGTKAVHMVIIHLVKIPTYAIFGAMSWQSVEAGLAIGLAAIPANLLGKYILSRYINAQQFRLVILATMGISGVWMLWQQRSLFSF